MLSLGLGLGLGCVCVVSHAGSVIHRVTITSDELVPGTNCIYCPPSYLLVFAWQMELLETAYPEITFDTPDPRPSMRAALAQAAPLDQRGGGVARQGKPHPLLFYSDNPRCCCAPFALDA